MESLLSSVSANLITPKPVKMPKSNGAGLVVADDHVSHHVDTLSVSGLPEKCKVPFHLHVDRGSATGIIKLDLNQRLERITKVKLRASKMEGYAADDMFLLEFPGSTGMPSGMNTHGNVDMRRNMIMLPTAFSSYNNMEIARWKNGAGRLESIEVRVRDVNGTPSNSWDDLFLWLEVTKVGWY